jgi:arylsulfatase A-like enzyme/Flp pilus assembly protein TadD
MMKLALVPALVSLPGCEPAPPGPSEEGFLRPSILLVTIDTLRADRLSPAGPMPQLRALAGRGVRFSVARSPVPLTLPAHTTLLTGLAPQHHLVRDNVGYTLHESTPTITESFSRAGYSTGAFVGGYPLAREFGLARGFDRYDDDMTRTPATARAGHTERRAEEVVAAAIDWMVDRRAEPLFVWVHLFDPHDPYEAPESFRGRHPHAYDDEVAYADSALGRLATWVESSLKTDVWIFVTSDHGEALGEHGEPTHGVFLYESSLRVPLVVVPPHGESSRVVRHPVSLVDLAPTMLQVAQQEGLADLDGRSLLSAISDGTTASLEQTATLFIESIHGRRKYGWSVLTGFLDGSQKFIAAPTPELYDLANDPAETVNLYSKSRSTELRLRLSAVGATRSESSPIAAIDSDLNKMHSLGYLGGSSVAATTKVLHDRSRPDPKDRIGAVPGLDRGLLAMAEGRYDDASVEFRAALGLDPQNLVGLNNLGIVSLRQGNVDRAIELLGEGLRNDPAAENIANNLGIALSRQGRHREAADAYRQALGARPGFTAARFNLAIALHRLGSHAAALVELERVQEENPGFPELQSTIDRVRASRSGNG